MNQAGRDKLRSGRTRGATGKFLVCWDGDGGNQGGWMILCEG